jgi:hypothetical protein
MDGETPSLPSAAQGMTATRHPYRWQQRLRLPTKTPRPSRAAIPGRDRVLSVPMCLIVQPGEWTVRHHPYRMQPREWTVRHHPYQVQPGEWTVRHHPYRMQPGEWTARRHPYRWQLSPRRPRFKKRQSPPSRPRRSKGCSVRPRTVGKSHRASRAQCQLSFTECIQKPKLFGDG